MTVNTAQRVYLVYLVDTGKILRRHTTSDPTNITVNTGESVYAGDADSDNYKIINGFLVEQSDDDRAPARAQERKREIAREQFQRTKNKFTFMNTLFDFDTVSQTRIDGASALAIAAMASGAQVGDLRWHGGTEDFAWITQDNSIILMDAQTVLGLGKAAAEHVRAHVFAARALKDDPTITDVTADIHWP